MSRTDPYTANGTVSQGELLRRIDSICDAIDVFRAEQDAQGRTMELLIHETRSIAAGAMSTPLNKPTDSPPPQVTEIAGVKGSSGTIPNRCR